MTASAATASSPAARARRRPPDDGVASTARSDSRGPPAAAATTRAPAPIASAQARRSPRYGVPHRAHDRVAEPGVELVEHEVACAGHPGREQPGGRGDRDAAGPDAAPPVGRAHDAEREQCHAGDAEHDRRRQRERARRRGERAQRALRPLVSTASSDGSVSGGMFSAARHPPEAVRGAQRPMPATRSDASAFASVNNTWCRRAAAARNSVSNAGSSSASIVGGLLDRGLSAHAARAASSTTRVATRAPSPAGPRPSAACSTARSAKASWSRIA